MEVDRKGQLAENISFTLNLSMFFSLLSRCISITCSDDDFEWKKNYFFSQSMLWKIILMDILNEEMMQWKKSVSFLQKCMVTICQLAYWGLADQLDNYVHMGEQLASNPCPTFANVIQILRCVLEKSQCNWHRSFVSNAWAEARFY